MEEIDIAKDERDLKRKISVTIRSGDLGTRIFAVAKSKGASLNSTLKIPTIYGDPIGEDVHDLVRDCYLVEGVEFLDLGVVPVQAHITMEDMCEWEIRTPIPLILLKRHFKEDQKQMLEQWTQRFDNDYHISFLQVAEVY